MRICEFNEMYEKCPACNADRKIVINDVSYCESEHYNIPQTHGKSAEYVTSTTFNSPSITPHLHITCGRCRFEMLIEVYNAERIQKTR